VRERDRPRRLHAAVRWSQECQAGPLKSTVPSTLTVAACGTPTTFDLKLKGKGTKQKANKRILRMKATAVAGTSPSKDQDSFKFVCKPRTTPCSPSGAFVE
jgi:hypothetical protein